MLSIFSILRYNLNRQTFEKGDFMLFINYPTRDQWREWDQNKMKAFNYMGGWCDVDENALGGVECVELDSWHDLYLVKHFCPLVAEKRYSDVWISPDGDYYDGNAHDVAAEHLLKIIYGEPEDEHIFCAGDKLEALGWVRATTSMMWQVRLEDWKHKTVTQAQFDALWDYCCCHAIRFPSGIEII